MKRFFCLTMVALSFLVAGSADATPTPALISFTDPDVFFSQSHTLGWKFTANDNMGVTALGFYDFEQNGFAANHLVGLWDAGGTLLAAVDLSAGTGTALIGDFRYVDLGGTVGLTSGSDYYIAGTTDSDDWVFQAQNIVTDARLSYSGSYFNTGSGLNFPDSFALDREYMTTNFLIDGAPVPEPATMTLMGLGLAGIALRRRKARVT